MIVVDTNIIGYLFLTSEWSPVVEKVFLKDPIWAAPLLWRSQLRNVLALYLRQGVFSLDDARAIMSKTELLMCGGECEALSPEVLRLAAEGRCSAYECEFVALAAPLVTVDEKIRSAFPQIALSPQDFLRG